MQSDLPYGAMPMAPSACQQSMYCSSCNHAAGGMILRIFRLDTLTAPPTVKKSLNFALAPTTHKTGDVWHIQIDNLRGLDTLAYAWEAQGELGWRGSLRYAPGLPLLDPYATLARTIKLPESEVGGLEFLAGELVPCPRTYESLHQASLHQAVSMRDHRRRRAARSSRAGRHACVTMLPDQLPAASSQWQGSREVPNRGVQLENNCSSGGAAAGL